MRWSSRKLFVTLFTLSLTSVLAWYGKLDTASATGLVAMATAYLGSNVGQKVTVKPDA